MNNYKDGAKLSTVNVEKQIKGGGLHDKANKKYSGSWSPST